MTSLSQPAHLLLRADASAAIGAGHVMRCLALAQAWRATGGTFSFACRSLGAALEARIIECGGSVVELDAGDDAAVTALAAQRSRAAAVVIDGYQFTTAHDRSCGEIGAVTLVVDDNGEHQRFESDFVLNQNLHAREELYRNRSERCELLLGLRYLLLRPEFSLGQKRVTELVASTVLLSFGASDIGGLTARVLSALPESGRRYRVLLGALVPEREALERRFAARRDVEFVFDARDVSAHMRWADVAALAAGSTVWEAASVGLPAVVVCVAANQVEVAAKAAELGLVRSLGHERTLSGATIVAAIDQLASDVDARARMAQIGPKVVDGAGAGRVVDELRKRVSAPR